MHRFKNNVSDGWLFAQEIRLFNNFARNWTDDVEDCDFFDIFANARNASEKEALAYFKKHFTIQELIMLDDFVPISRKNTAKKERVASRMSRRSGTSNEGCGEEPDDVAFRREVDDALKVIWNHKPFRARCRAMLREWSDEILRRKTRACKRKDPIAKRLDEIVRVLKLNDVERDILIYSTVRRMTCFDDFPGGRTNGRHDILVYYAMATDYPCSAVEKALSGTASLRRYGVLDGDGDFEGSGRNPFKNYLEGGADEMLEGRFYRRLNVDDALPPDYYGKMNDEHGAMLRDLVVAGRKGRRGVNILLYGAPGTGKTSYVKTLAKELSLNLYEIRQGDKDGEDDSAQCRQAGIRICNEQVAREESLILVDEADQLLRSSVGFFSFFGGGDSRTGTEKGVVNSILDEIKVPTVWVSNAPASQMDDSVRRRFDYSICFEKLNARQRQAIWRNNVGKLGLGKEISEPLIATLADRYQASAGGITMVLENVKRMRRARGGKVEDLIDRLMKPHCELMSVRKRDDALKPSADYSLDGLNLKGDVALAQVVEAVRSFRATKDGEGDPDRPRMNLLLWGPPGTGKTEFVKYLAKEVGARVNVKMGSDILSMWVGGTEQNIARAFREAEAEDAILFFDEIDGLVQDRSGANRSWEVTQVNELLHQMENFKGVMVAATNFMDNLDQAILRRFTFKFEFDYLDDAGKRLFFERMFHSSLTDAEAKRLAAIPNLAPGDFRTVRQGMFYLPGEKTNALRLTELEKESEVKKDTRRAARKVGF